MASTPGVISEPQLPLNLSADLLYYDNLVGEASKLSLPSPRLDDPSDFLQPVLEVSPLLAHPVSHIRYKDKLKESVQKMPASSLVERVGVFKNKGEIVFSTSLTPFVLREMHIDVSRHYPLKDKKKDLHYTTDVEIRRSVYKCIVEMGRLPTDILKFRFSQHYDYAYHSQDYSDAVDMHERFFDEYVRRRDTIECLEIARADVLEALLAKGYRFDMLSDPCNGIHGDGIFRAAASLKIPLIIQAMPALKSNRFKVKGGELRGLSLEQ